MTEPRSDYREIEPPPDLADRVACFWINAAAGVSPYVQRVLPDACMDIIWTGDGLLVAGPDTQPSFATLPPGRPLTAVRFRPGAAPPLLGVPAHALRNERVALDELWDGSAEQLAERVAQTHRPADVIRTLRTVIGERLAASGPPDPVSVLVVRASRRGMGVRELAERSGLSERQLRRRSMAAFGYGPKTLHRILRFQRAMRLAARQPNFATVAATAGYADQAHLARDVKELAGMPLGQLVNRS